MDRQEGSGAVIGNRCVPAHAARAAALLAGTNCLQRDGVARS